VFTGKRDKQQQLIIINRLQTKKRKVGGSTRPHRLGVERRKREVIVSSMSGGGTPPFLESGDRFWERRAKQGCMQEKKKLKQKFSVKK